MKSFLLFLSLILTANCIHSQTYPIEICGYRTELDKIIRRQPNYLIWQNALYEKAMQEFKELQSAKRKILNDTLYFEIPVVFHILYNNSEENIGQDLILSQLKELNEGFRKQTADTSRIRSIFKPIAADVRVQFVLATKDPSGNPTSGINRISTTLTTFATIQFGYYTYTNKMKYTNSGGKDAWDPTSYMNIWICDMEYPGSPSIVYGFATPPTGAPNWNNTGNVTKDSTDKESGVVLHYKIVGKNNPLAPVKYNEGKSALHEVGHYLGLRHIWGDGTNTTGCTLDDGIFDTPNARLSNSSCFGQNSCTDASNDNPDMTENYMDYALDGCAAMFTMQQAYMMRYVLNNCRTGLPIRYIKYDTIPDPPSAFVDYKVYPNPASNKSEFKVMIHSPITADFNVSLIDMSGRQILNRTIRSNSEQSFQTEGIASAVYYVIIRDLEGATIGREMLLLL